MLFNVARRAKLVERALGHPGEDVYHWVDAILLIAVGKGHDLDSIGKECPVEEAVEKKHLPCDAKKNNESDDEIMFRKCFFDLGKLIDD